jgi:HAE1 family hydrophobic/amphiphilic exporter-1
VAEVKDGFAEMTGYSLRNGRPNVGIPSRARATPRPSASPTIAQAGRGDPQGAAQGTTLEITQDGGKDAESSLHNVIHALVFGAGLTIFVVYAFLNSWRSP